MPVGSRWPAVLWLLSGTVAAAQPVASPAIEAPLRLSVGLGVRGLHRVPITGGEVSLGFSGVFGARSGYSIHLTTFVGATSQALPVVHPQFGIVFERRWERVRLGGGTQMAWIVVRRALREGVLWDVGFGAMLQALVDFGRSRGLAGFVGARVGVDLFPASTWELEAAAVYFGTALLGLRI